MFIFFTHEWDNIAVILVSANLAPTSRQYFTLNSFPVVKALVSQPHRGRHDVVLRPFSQGLIVETKPLLYKFCAIVSTTLQYN